MTDEGEAPRNFDSQAWKKKGFVVGETYTVVGNPARGGRHMVLVGTLTFPDGKVFRRGADFDDAGYK